jgi:DNA-binding transcriptional MerR regulator
VSSERHADPEVGQALEQVREALRTERNSQEPLSSQNAELRERAGRLERERDQLRGELERLRQERPARAPRLPEVLTPPFEVGPSVSPRRQVREAMPMFLVMLLALSVVWRKSASSLVLLLCALVLVVVQVLIYWAGRVRWRFTQDGIQVETKELEVPGGFLRYTDVLKVEAYSSRGQRLRGVGSVGMAYKAVTGEERLLTLKDVPEPERLAEWLQAKRSGAV